MFDLICVSVNDGEEDNDLVAVRCCWINRFLKSIDVSRKASTNCEHSGTATFRRYNPGDDSNEALKRTDRINAQNISARRDT
jgi:hypothetical protein